MFDILKHFLGKNETENSAEDMPRNSIEQTPQKRDIVSVHHAEALLEMLPKPEKEAVPDESFNDRILLLLAAVANSDGIMTYRGYQVVLEATQAIFGERAMHAEVQAKLHYALLHPPVNATEIASTMAQQAKDQQVSATFIHTMLVALSSISSHAERIDKDAQNLVHDIEWAFRKDSLEEEQKQTHFLNTVSDGLGNFYRLASNVLPIKSEPKLLKSHFTPETSVFNAKMESAITSLDRIAWTLNDIDLQKELHTFKKTLQNQSFKIVIVGERKRGKSSLVNAIIGQNLSPVRESTPETATVLEFHYAPAPDYSVKFLDSAQFSWLEDYLAGEENNTLLTNKIAEIRKGVENGTFMPGKLLSGVSCWEELPDYVSLDGQYSGFVSRVEVGLPLKFLQNNITVIDTPGLNDVDQFHDYLAYEESLEADCVLFVMDARDPGSHSELSLLRRLVRSGRAVRIIGVLTNIDKLNDETSLHTAKEQAKSVLLEGCRGSEYVQLAGIVGVNTRKAMQIRCTSPKEKSDLDELLNILQKVINLDILKENYRNKVAENYLRLVGVTQEHIKQYMQVYRDSLPDQTFLNMLECHAHDLNKAAQQSLDQARKVIEATGSDLDIWSQNIQRDLSIFKQTLSLRLTVKISTKITELGDNFAKKEEWESFEAIIKETAEETIKEFLASQQTIFQAWEAKLRLFAHTMDKLSADCLKRISEDVEGISEVTYEDADCVQSTNIMNTATHFLVQSHLHMKNLAVFTSGLSVGRASALLPLTMLVTAGNILALATANPIPAVILTALVSAALTLFKIGGSESLRARFLEQKRKNVEIFSEKVTEILAEKLNEIQQDVGKAYAFEVRRSFAPALQNLLQQSLHMRLFLDVMDKTRLDVDRYEDRVTLELQELRQLSLTEQKKEIK